VVPWQRQRNSRVPTETSPSVIRMIKSRRVRFAGNLQTGKKKSACRIVVGSVEGKRPLGIPRRRLLDKI
jgi:hypothetical protein